MDLNYQQRLMEVQIWYCHIGSPVTAMQLAHASSQVSHGERENSPSSPRRQVDGPQPSSSPKLSLIFFAFFLALAFAADVESS